MELEEGVYQQVGGGAEVKGIDEQVGGGGHEKQQGLLLKDAHDDAGVTEEAVAEVMRWLEAGITDDASAGFVTINGNEESCGPSFSSAASTVMAAVDTGAGAPPFPEPVAAAKKQQEAADDAAWLDELLLACGPATLDGV
jgi:hypothetical protein